MRRNGQRRSQVISSCLQEGLQGVDQTLQFSAYAPGGGWRLGNGIGKDSVGVAARLDQPGEADVANCIRRVRSQRASTAVAVL